MIDLTGMNNKEFILTNGRKYIVLESVDEVKDAVLRYKNRIFTYRL